MTPGLAVAGFVADGNDRQTWDDIVAAVLESLAAEFEVVPERAAPPVPGGSAPGGGRRTTWLDTFDWRLSKAGLTLEYVPGRGGGELRLSDTGTSAGTAVGGAGTAEDATQLVTGWQASRPHLLTDLAGGPVGVRIAGLVAPRALIPVVTTSTNTAVYRLLNGDSKTVARLLIDQPSLAGPQSPPSGSAGSVSLPPRLAIAGVRGYQGQERRAARLVAAVPGIKPGAAPPFADALRAIGRRPGDYSNKVDADITAVMPASVAASSGRQPT
jgi:hypothetical protein